MATKWRSTCLGCWRPSGHPAYWQDHVWAGCSCLTLAVHSHGRRSPHHAIFRVAAGAPDACFATATCALDPCDAWAHVITGVHVTLRQRLCRRVHHNDSVSCRTVEPAKSALNTLRSTHLIWCTCTAFVRPQQISGSCRACTVSQPTLKGTPWRSRLTSSGTDLQAPMLQRCCGCAL